ncbi:MAG: hypothetical protein A3K19_26400 [Lentisphaerae bacterium RIFOXYB12_FULL_65_16]|nr:MAG: hypothetical protein A3K18_08570 [Lentisphaerae bacterium RIFOXYA12_64_32]OGV87806.1 MAG: hypothetical protein A3K19_26400 [Lentisphaerae bacterium RIFOXYB12_FULL_65_16]
MKRFVIVGVGGRGTDSYAATIIKEFAGRVEIVGIHDSNPKRMEACNRLLGANLPMYTDFDEMLRKARPDAVVVTSKDSTHAQYVVKALDAGCMTYSEKPLCTSVDHIRAIRAAAARSTAKGYVTHNMRFVPDIEVIKQHLVNGAIGKILHISFAETLDRYHGADYFRRWHRFMENSAGLLIHKSSHHFDIVNWFADSVPETVTALGRQAFYGSNGPFHGNRCSDCPHTGTCEFYADVFKSERMRIMYKEPEVVDGYFRDGCVFDPRIDITDTISASIAYRNGVVANYSLVAYAAYESMRVAIEGTLGRIEIFHRYGTSWAVGNTQNDGKGSLANDGEDAGSYQKSHLYLPRERKRLEITAPPATGGHGGSDPKLREYLFGDSIIPDPLRQKAPLEEGIQAVLVGLAANASIQRQGAPIAVQGMCGGES